MKRISIADVTLECAARGAELSFKERIEIARSLQNLRVDVIHLPAVENVKVDSLFVRTITPFVKSAVICVPAGSDEASAKAAWETVSSASRPRLRVELPVSPVQMEYVCHKKEPAMLEYIASLVSCCSALCPEVEFRALDATRAEREFLKKAVAAAEGAGASIITVCDSEGAMMSDEFGEFIAQLRELVSVKLGVLCDNAFGLALSSTLLAARAGADELTVSFKNGYAPSAEAAAKLLGARADDLGLQTSLKFTEFGRTAKQIAWITSTRRSDKSPFDSGVSAPSSSPVPELKAADSIASVKKAVEKLGYDLSEEDIAKVYEEFCRVAEKKAVGPRELDAIVASAALQVPSTYKLVSYVINSGNVITPSAHIKLEKNGKQLESVCLGDGPVDASFLAIEHIVGHHYELDDFQIQAVTEGREAMGSTVVKLRSRGKLYSGNGISTDILGASIGAYLNALNKIIYEES